MNGATVLLAAVLAMPLAAPAPLEVATQLLGEGFATSIVARLCTMQGQLNQAAANVRRERPDLTDEQVDAFRDQLAASAPELRAACDQRVRDVLGGEDGPLAHYAEQLHAALEKSPVPREFEQLRAYLESPAGRHAEAARRSVDADAYVRFVPWAQHLAPALYDELGMMLRADVGPLPAKPGDAAVSVPTPAEASSLGRARLRNAASLGTACASFYPAASRRMNEEGSVVMLVYVLPNGRLGGVLVESSSGFPALDVAAAGCIGAIAEFEARRDDGQPVGSWQRMKWTWRLAN